MNGETIFFYYSLHSVVYGKGLSFEKCVFLCGHVGPTVLMMLILLRAMMMMDLSFDKKRSQQYRN